MKDGGKGKGKLWGKKDERNRVIRECRRVKKNREISRRGNFGLKDKN